MDYLKQNWVPMSFLKFHRIAGAVLAGCSILLMLALIAQFSSYSIFYSDIQRTLQLVRLVCLGIQAVFQAFVAYSFYWMDRKGYRMFLAYYLSYPFLFFLTSNPLAWPGIEMSALIFLIVYGPLAFLCIWYYEKRRFFFCPEAELPVVRPGTNGRFRLGTTSAIRKRITVLFLLFLAIWLASAVAVFVEYSLLLYFLW